MPQEKEILSDRYLLTVEQAHVYFHIGKQKLRTIAAMNPGANFYLMNGNRIMFIRPKFEDFLSRQSAI